MSRASAPLRISNSPPRASGWCGLALEAILRRGGSRSSVPLAAAFGLDFGELGERPHQRVGPVWRGPGDACRGHPTKFILQLGITAEVMNPPLLIQSGSIAASRTNRKSAQPVTLMSRGEGPLTTQS